MAHMLRKYTSNRGSALFMVISTMTALFISCMAMYFSMVSARSSQFAMFNKMQANQSAMSIVQIVKTALSTPSDPLFEVVNGLDEGESITTDSNGFKSLDPNVAALLDEDQVGSYSVTITCLKKVTSGGVTFPVVDIMVITSVDGNRQSVHMTASLGIVANFPGGVNGSGGDAELFAATGYVPNDAYLYSGHFLTDVFYDTQFTYINPNKSGFASSASEMRIAQSINTGGSLLVHNGAMALVGHDQGYPDYVNSIGPVTWAVRGDLYYYLGNDYDMRGGSEVLVGGNFYKDNGNSFIKINNGGYNGTKPIDDSATKHISIYVNGDFDYNGDFKDGYAYIFVNGNVKNLSASGSKPNLKLFVTGATDEERRAKVDSAWSGEIYEWPKTATSFADGMTYVEFINKLNEKTKTIPYYKWDLSENTKDGVAQHINIYLNSSNSPITYNSETLEAGTNAYVISYDENTSSADLIKTAENPSGIYPGVFGNSFVIEDVYTPYGDPQTGQAIIIDTGDDPDNIITIRLKALNADGVFAWFREPGSYVWNGETNTVEMTDYPTGEFGGAPRLVLYRGRGTVLIDVPEGVTYQESHQQMTIHQSMFLAVGGDIETKTLGGKTIYNFKLNPQGQYASKVINYVHKDCNSDTDECSYTFNELDPEEVFCEECGSTVEVGGHVLKMLEVECGVHGVVNKYCPNCYPQQANRKDWCVNRVDKKAFDNFVAHELNHNLVQYVKDDENKTIYPNVNFMLVSCEESSDMLFSKRVNRSDISNNNFYGFVYAPYITFYGEGGSGGTTLKICGGMTVSDYHFNSTHAYISCYPDRMPNEVAALDGGGNISGGPLAGASKSWKIEFGGIS